VFTTGGTYPWSFVTQLFHSGQSRHGGVRKTVGSDDFNLTTRTKGRQYILGGFICSTTGHQQTLLTK
jgi:hypothetical protein